MAQPFTEPCDSGVIAAEPCPFERGQGAAPRHRGWVLTACVLASAMVFIDGSALTVAVPKLRAAFAADLATVQWVLNGYVLALASLALVGGALGDAFGKARMLRVSCFAFGHASLAVGALGPLALLGVSFAVLVAPLTASVLSSLDAADQGLASGVNNAISRVAQLAGIALAAGIGAYAFGYEVGLAIAAVLSAAGAAAVAVMVERKTAD